MPTSTRPQLDTPFNYPQAEILTEIEVTDPTHPLYGRRFALSSISPRPQGSEYVLVSYHDYIVLRIPVLATNLVSLRPTTPTKLTLQAITELISVAEQCEVLCQSNPSKSGTDCLQNCKDGSATISQRSSRR